MAVEKKLIYDFDEFFCMLNCRMKPRLQLVEAPVLSYEFVEKVSCEPHLGDNNYLCVD